MFMCNMSVNSGKIMKTLENCMQIFKYGYRELNIFLLKTYENWNKAKLLFI